MIYTRGGTDGHDCVQDGDGGDGGEALEALAHFLAFVAQLTGPASELTGSRRGLGLSSRLTAVHVFHDLGLKTGGWEPFLKALKF